ncbi:MAG: hypothetical protein ACRDSJ_14330 [Rubrobacteraceae bacterium]
MVVLVFGALLSVGVLFALGTAEVRAQEDSVYDDPENPVLASLLAQEEYAEDFQEEFDLSDEEMEQVLEVVREENETVSRAMYESNPTITGTANEAAVSGFNETVMEENAETKSEIEEILPEDEQDELETWTNERSTEARRDCSGTRDPKKQPRKGSTERVFATQYHGYTNFEVALPHRKLKFDGGYRVRISYKGRSVSAPVKEVGPWNTYDNYWQSKKYRTDWKKLGRGMPEAEAAWCDGFNRGRDEQGRIVRNPAGIDLTPAVARKLGLGKLENAWVVVNYTWVKR